MGCNQTKKEEILDCLNGKEISSILTANFSKNLLRDPWTPVIDIEFTSKPFLSKHVKSYLESGQFNTDIEVMIGTTADEGINIIGSYINGDLEVGTDDQNSNSGLNPIEIFCLSFVIPLYSNHFTLNRLFNFKFETF